MGHLGPLQVIKINSKTPEGKLKYIITAGKKGGEKGRGVAGKL